jgi:serine/threonine protein kinase
MVDDTPAPELAPGTLLDGRYRVGRALGAGGSSRVYECEHVRTRRRFAVKVSEPEGAARLEQEARATSLLASSRVVKAVDLGTDASAGDFLVMELHAGGTLRDLLDDVGQLPLELAAEVCLQICECLHEAHGAGLVHRDLKPENVLLTPSALPDRYDARVLDFGIVKVVHEAALPNPELTRVGSTVGTPYYMSLEQLRSPTKVDARADLYSLGVMLYECLAGARPYEADTIGDLVFALASGPAPSLALVRPDLPPSVVDLVASLLLARPAARPASAVAVARALLPLASPSFGPLSALWLEVDGRRPAVEQLARGAAARQSASRTASLVPAGPPAALGSAPSPLAPRAPAPSAPADDTTAPLSDERPRDTPTRMMSAVPLPLLEEGDRSTPTQAIQATSVEEALAARGFAPPPSPFAATSTPPPPPPPPSFVSQPRVEASPPSPLAPGSALVTGPAPALVVVPPGLTATAAPPERVPPSLVPAAPVFGPPPTLKPPWRRRLEQAFATAVELIDDARIAVRGAPPRVQTALLVAVVAAGILSVVALLVLVLS